MNFPSFDEKLPHLHIFIQELVEDYHAGRINTWDEIDARVKEFFTPERMEQTERVVPGWTQMASHSKGVTLTHVLCVFLGLVLLPEFASLSFEQQQLAQWIVLFHDVEKIHIRGRRDLTHGFRSAVVTAGALHPLGFPVTTGFHTMYPTWRELTYFAITADGTSGEQIQDNTKLPEITSGITAMFGSDSPASLIVMGVLLHMSINVVKDWPQAAPLTDAEIMQYVSAPLLPLLKAMCLSDNEGWSMFDPDIRIIQRNDTLEAFRALEQNIIS